MLIEPCPDGIILTVKACPGAKRNEVRYADDILKVYVTQIPEKGKANESVRKQLIQFLKLRASQVELIHGETSPQKKILIRNVTEEELLRMLQKQINPRGVSKEESMQ